MLLYISVDGIDDYFKKVWSKVTQVKELHKTFYGVNEFLIKDNNGYLIAFAEAAESGE